MTDEATRQGIEYRTIPGFTGYRAGSDGSIWSCLKRRGSLKYVQTDEWKELAQTRLPSGYRWIALRSDSGNFVGRGVHRFVLMAFVGPCPEGMQGCHYNGNRDDNRIENLRWDTSKENHRDRDRIGKVYRGEKNPAAKLTEAQAIEIRQRRQRGDKRHDLAAEFGVSVVTVDKIFYGEIWAHV